MKYLILALTILLFAVPAAAQQQPPADLGAVRAFVYLGGTATVSGAQIKLGQVADINGFDEDLINRLEQMPLGQAPLPGQTRTIERNDIRRQMATWRIDAVRVAIAGEPAVTVKRKGRSVTSGEITSLVEQWVTDSWRDRNVRTDVVFTRLPDELTLKEEDFTLSVLDPVRPQASGAMALSVAALDGDRVLARFPVSIRLRVWQEVAVAAADLKRGKIVSEDDILFSERELTGNRSQTISSVDQLVDKRLRRRVRAGDLLTAGHLENPPLVERGDKIILIVEYNGIRIGCAGKAWQKGGLGDRILVSTQYGKKLTGVVKDGRTVVIAP
ncbi:MAG: flagellar basal body P-ring formation protein FlgA [Candidatus Glassbacteria bacterium]|nr:flagellar basal body P-ring formation protein FlgA [Candidatus Glassbacteria bacterium]